MSSCSVVWWEKWIGQAGCDDSCSVGVRALGPRAAEPSASGTSSLIAVRQGWAVHGFFSVIPMTSF